MSVPRLTVHALNKAFGVNRVLRDLELDLGCGEIHALVGGNGAGKSTFSKIVAGIERADAGQLRLDDTPYAPTNRRQAAAAGVVMVMQELNILPTLTVAENLFLQDLPARRGVLDFRRLHDRARSALDRVGLGSLDPATCAGELGIGQQQLVEIAGALTQHCRVLILDEPTAALTHGETLTLSRLLTDLRAAGTTILYISHRLEEIARLADRVSVLRDGRLVTTLPVAAAPRSKLIELMAGTSAPDSAPAARLGRSGEVVMSVRDLHAGTAVRGVSLKLHRGEILGLGGLVGAGRTELLRALYGADPIAAGEVQLLGSATRFSPRSPADAIARGFALVPEDRKQHGILAPLSLRENVALPSLHTRSGLGLVDALAENARTVRLIDALAVRCVDADQPIAELSGGNQQKLVVSRWLDCGVRIWLLDEPTRGVDVDARRRTYALLAERAAAGDAMIVASSDFEELAALCHRVLVMSQGTITGEFTPATLTPDAFMSAAFRGFGA